MKRHIHTLTAIVLFCSGFSTAGEVQTIDAPDATNTYIYGIDGDKVVGYYTYGSLTLGFVYDGTNWTTLRKGASTHTIALGIDGDNILAQYTDSQGWHNAIFNGTTWTTIADSIEWYPRSISGDNVLGSYESGPLNLAVIYNISTATMRNIIPQPAGRIEVQGIDGDNIVGVNITTEHYSNPTYHGFLYNGSTWTLLDAPGATRTEAYAIDGSNIVGIYQSGTRYYTFLYDGSTWRTLDRTVLPFDMDGDKIVGSYTDGSGSHGFIYTIPEPATLLLLGLGAVMLRRKR